MSIHLSTLKTPLKTVANTALTVASKAGKCVNKSGKAVSELAHVIQELTKQAKPIFDQYNKINSNELIKSKNRSISQTDIKNILSLISETAGLVDEVAKGISYVGETLSKIKKKN